MSWLSETVRHVSPMWRYRQVCGFALPAPLDVLVLVHDDRATLTSFIEAMTSRTHWPLRIWLCDLASTDAMTRDILRAWEGRSIAGHEVRVVRTDDVRHPEGFNAALPSVIGDVIAVSDGKILVPDMGDVCWATVMLKAMQTYPHVGWLNATLRMPSLPPLPQRERKSVKGTQANVVRDSPDTQLAIVRRDFLGRAVNSHEALLDPYREPHAKFDTGRCVGVNITLHEAVLSQGVQPTASVRSSELSITEGQGEPALYIVTRTHARRESFRRCRESITRQTAFDRIVHVVTCEMEDDLSYVPSDCRKVRVRPDPRVSCWYETYVNEALAAIDGPGFVLILDDDDYIVNSQLAETILAAYDETDAVFFRTRLHDRRVIPYSLPFAAPPFGDIASCGYVLRMDVARLCRWEPGHAGDFRYVNNVFRLVLAGKRRIAWSEAVVTATQQGRSRGRAHIEPKQELRYTREPITLYRVAQDGSVSPISPMEANE